MELKLFTGLQEELSNIIAWISNCSLNPGCSKVCHFVAQWSNERAKCSVRKYRLWNQNSSTGRGVHLQLNSNLCPHFRESLPPCYTSTWVLSAYLLIDPARWLALSIQLCSHSLKLNVIHVFQRFAQTRLNTESLIRTKVPQSFPEQ